MLGTLNTSQIKTPTSRRRWTTRGVSRNLCPSLPSVTPPNMASSLRMSILSLRPAINCITLSCLPFGSIFFHALHSLFNIICSCRGPLYLHHSVGTSWPPYLISLFHSSFSYGSVIFMYSLHGCIHLNSPKSPTDGTIKLNPMSLALPMERPSLCECYQNNRIATPGASTTALVICSLRPSWNISAIN